MIANLLTGLYMRATLVLNGLNTRFDKYGPMIHKKHAFVPSVSGMVKVDKNIKPRKLFMNI